MSDFTPPQIPATLEEAKGQLGLRLYGFVGEQIRAQELAAMGIEGAGPATVPVGGEVSVGAVLDAGEQVVPINEGLARDQWGSDAQQVIAAAVEASRGYQTNNVALVQPGTYAITDERFGAYCLLEPTALQAFDVNGAPVAIAPGRGVVLITGSQDQEGLIAAAGAAAQVAESGEGLVSWLPLTHTGQGWVPFEIPADEATQQAFGHTARIINSGHYARQREVLAEGQAFPASAQVFQREGWTIMVGTWSRGVETLLPVVDDVAISSDDGDIQLMPFGEFVALAGVTETPMVPKRYHVPADLQV